MSYTFGTGLISERLERSMCGPEKQQRPTRWRGWSLRLPHPRHAKVAVLEQLDATVVAITGVPLQHH